MTGLLLDALLRGVLGAGRKRSRRATRFLSGGRGSPFGGASTLLTAAGVAWGIYETLQRSPGASAGPVQSEPGAAGSAAGIPPPVPPLPGPPGATPPARDGLRLLRLAISAAHADGNLSEQERAAILQQTKSADADGILERELAQPRPVAEIVAGVTDQAEAATLYVLAYTILRADEHISGSERIYLAQLASLLGLTPAMAQSLEEDTGQRIDALGDQGQPGG